MGENQLIGLGGLESKVLRVFLCSKLHPQQVHIQVSLEEQINWETRLQKWEIFCLVSTWEPPSPLIVFASLLYRSQDTHLTSTLTVQKVGTLHSQPVIKNPLTPRSVVLSAARQEGWKCSLPPAPTTEEVLHHVAGGKLHSCLPRVSGQSGISTIGE